MFIKTKQLGRTVMKVRNPICVRTPVSIIFMLVYEQQKSQGRETALAHKNDVKTFDVKIYPVKAQAETRVRLGKICSGILYRNPVKSCIS
jgi:hypothetical protein